MPRPLPVLPPRLEYVRFTFFLGRAQSSSSLSWVLAREALVVLRTSLWFRLCPWVAFANPERSLFKIATLDVNARSRRWHLAAVHSFSLSVLNRLALTVESGRRTGVKPCKGMLVVNVLDDILKVLQPSQPIS